MIHTSVSRADVCDDDLRRSYSARPAHAGDAPHLSHASIFIICALGWCACIGEMQVGEFTDELKELRDKNLAQFF